jgi:predicted RNase H-like HicB family nuclease
MPEAITQGKDMNELMFMMEDAIELALECMGIPKPKIN